MSPLAILVDLLLNAIFIRNSLSYIIRQKLLKKPSELPWLRYCWKEKKVENLVELDDLFLQMGGDFFGCYVNPMRSRKEMGFEGFFLFVRELELFARQASTFAAEYLEIGCPQTFLDKLRTVPGFNGSGFRAQEILVDVVENSLHLFEESQRKLVQAKFAEVHVIGVGPCRVANWMLGRAFFLNETMLPIAKEKVYLPVLIELVQYLKRTYPQRYQDTPALDVLYELCEFNKALLCMYLGSGKEYVCTNYDVPLVPTSLLELSLADFTSMRETAVTFLHSKKGRAVEDAFVDAEFSPFDV